MLNVSSTRSHKDELKMAAEQESHLVSHLYELCSSKLIWEIRDVKLRREAAEPELVSSVFSSRDYGAIIWKLKRVHGCLQLCLVSSDRPTLTCTVNWSYLDEGLQVIRQMKTVRHTFSKQNNHVVLPEDEPLTMSQTPPAEPPISVSSPEPPQSVSFEAACQDLEKCVVNDKLFIRVEVEVYVNMNCTRESKSSPKVPTVTLSDDIRRLLLNDESKDLLLLLRGQGLLVHKLIVAARCPLLAAILEADPTCIEIPIDDEDPQAMLLAVDFMYSDKIDNVEGRVDNDTLHAVACKYKLAGLQRQCEDAMRLL